jgi:hypothetical protein
MAGKRNGFAGVAKMIMLQTNDAKELVAFALGVMRDRQHPLSYRLQAHAWLSDRALGKPIQAIDMQARIDKDSSSTRANVDLDKLSTDELEQWYRLLGKLAAPPPQPKALEGRIEDAEIVEDDPAAGALPSAPARSALSAASARRPSLDR